MWFSAEKSCAPYHLSVNESEFLNLHFEGPGGSKGEIERTSIMKKNKIILGALIIILTWMVCLSVREAAVSAQTPDFKMILGEWVRPDGGMLSMYGMSILMVRSMQAISIPAKSISRKPVFPSGRVW